jgi:Flp pilus assembly pilin Flp
MTPRCARLIRSARLRRFARDESGATLVEFAVVVLFFLLLLFAIIDFGRLAHTWAAAQKATQVAARIAAVRPPVCAGVPVLNSRGVAGSSISFGTLCRAGANVCANPGPATCSGVSTNATTAEIFAQIRPLLPLGATEGNLRFTYSFDPNLGFLGGPYVPMVTVDLQGLEFVFVSNLGRMITPITGQETTLGANLPLPRMSISVPGEDLALGTAG